MKQLYVLLSLTLIINSLFSQELISLDENVKIDKDGTPYKITIDWNVSGNHKLITLPHIDDETTLQITHKNLNLFHYKLEYNIERKEDKNYQMLAKMLKSIVVPKHLITEMIPERLATITSAININDSLSKWLEIIILANHDLNIFLNGHLNSIGISDTTTFSSNEKVIINYIGKLKNIKTSILEVIKVQNHNVQNLKTYLEIDKLHNELLVGLNQFVETSKLIKKGSTKLIKPKKAGYKVTLKITPKNIASNLLLTHKSVNLTYFVRDDKKTIYHAGYIFTSNDISNYRKISGLNTETVYKSLNDKKSANGLVAFLSYPLNFLWESKTQDDYKILGTIGSDLKDFGTNLFIGLTLNYNKVLITGGIGIKSVKKVDPDSKVTGEIDLFQSLKESKENIPFIGISIPLY